MNNFKSYLSQPLTIAFCCAIVAAGIALLVRFFAIEFTEIGQLCDPGTGPWWCVPRAATYQAFRIWQPVGIGALGLAALIGGLGALVQGGRLAQCLAAALGAFGCVLYNADLAAPGLVLALVAAARQSHLPPKI